MHDFEWIRKRFLKGEMDAEQAIKALKAAGFPEKDAKTFVEEWENQK